MTKIKQSKIPKAKFPWHRECEGWPIIVGEVMCAVLLPLFLMVTDKAIIRLMAFVVFLPVVIHLVMETVASIGLYIILQAKTTPDEFLVYCNLGSNYGKKEMTAAGVDANFINQTDKKLLDIINRHFFFSVADRRVYQYAYDWR